METNRIVIPVQPAGARITSRIDAVTRIPVTYRRANPPAPRAVKIELTSQCNYRCGFCAHRLRMKKRGEMSWPLYTQLVGEMADAGVEELGLFFIGESFMCDWLPEAIAYAKGRGIKYAFLTTNGSLATADEVRACMDAGLDSLKFSMNNADEEQFREIAQVKASSSTIRSRTSRPLAASATKAATSAASTPPASGTTACSRSACRRW